MYDTLKSKLRNSTIAEIGLKNQVKVRIKSALDRLYGDRLKGIVLYGSEARKNADQDSDIDLLVLLDGPIEYAHEIKRIILALYDCQLEIDRPISAFPADAQDYYRQLTPLYRNVNNEGVRL
jgi:uncharacterized protein